MTSILVAVDPVSGEAQLSLKPPPLKKNKLKLCLCYLREKVAGIPK
jgi:hypothetical protein